MYTKRKGGHVLIENGSQAASDTTVFRSMNGQGNSIWLQLHSYLFDNLSFAKILPLLVGPITLTKIPAQARLLLQVQQLSGRYHGIMASQHIKQIPVEIH